MSPKATEGVGTTGLDILRQKKVSAPCARTPSGLPAISPSRGEITSPSSRRYMRRVRADVIADRLDDAVLVGFAEIGVHRQA